MNDYTDHSDVVTFDFSDKAKLEMLENWFQKRTEMTSKALKIILFPVYTVLFFAVIFLAFYVFTVPMIVSYIILLFIVISLLTLVICLFIGGGIFKKVRTGDSIMLRQIKSESKSEAILTNS